MALLEQKKTTRQFRFNPEKALEVMIYLAKHLPQPSIFYVSKVLYYADSEHLRNYCRFICGDHYIAMNNGAVPSNVYDIFKDVNGKHIRKHYDIPSEEAFRVDGNTLIPLREPNLDLLSASDIECLDNSIAENGQKSFSELSGRSHQERDYIEADPSTNEMSPLVMAEKFANGHELVSVLIGD